MGSAFLPIIPNFLRDVTVVLAKRAELSEGGVAGAVNEIGSSVVESLAFGSLERITGDSVPEFTSCP